MTPDERLRFSLSNPGAPGALTPRVAQAQLKAKILDNLARMAVELHDEAKSWLQDLAKTNPRQAFALYLELLEYTTPRQKAVEMNHNVNDSRPVQSRSIAELEALLQSSVVSTQ